MAKATQPLYNPNTEQLGRSLFRALNSNTDTFSQKIMVTKLKQIDGKERLDKDGNPLFDNLTGEPLRWDDIFQMTYSALNGGGEHTARITQSQYLSLKENSVYFASGRIVYKSYKDMYNTVPTVEFNKFENYEEIFILEMQKYMQAETGSVTDSVSSSISANSANVEK